VRGVSIAGAFLVLPILALLLLLRACGENGDWRFSARVVEVRAANVCLALVDDGPGYVNGCMPRGDVVGLPGDVRVGDCLRLNQHLHGDLDYEGHARC
jgi:hypothetical protein